MTPMDSERLLNESLQRCLNNEQFLEIFYRLFIESSPEIKSLFRNTDFQKQFDMMGKSLMTMIAASESNWISDQQLSRLANIHRKLNIKPEHFEIWESSLLASIKQCDPAFNEEIKKAWKIIVQRGKNFMLSNE